VDTLTQNVPFMKDGKLVGIAVTSRQRMALAPNVPTVIEAGFPKLVAENFLGISAPAGVPKDVVEKVHKAVNEVVARPDIVKRLEDLGVAPRKMTQAEFADFVAKQVAEWGPAVKATGAKLN
jgi:tripartite-type tricarboxylate transporter receptor subunit TctC